MKAMAPVTSLRSIAKGFVRKPRTVHQTIQAQRGAVVAPVTYVTQPPPGQEYFASKRPVKNGEKTSNLDLQTQEVLVHDLRTLDRPFSLDVQGFQLEQLQVPSDIDWSSADEVS